MKQKEQQVPTSLHGSILYSGLSKNLDTATSNILTGFEERWGLFGSFFF